MTKRIQNRGYLGMLGCALVFCAVAATAASAWAQTPPAPPRPAARAHRVPPDEREGPRREASPAAEGQPLVEERTGALTTSEGLRLRLVTEIGDVRILTADSGQVSYKVRLQADSREPDAQNLLKQYVLTAVSTPAGVELLGHMQWAKYRGPPAASREAHTPHLRVSLEVSVPRRYNLDVLTRAGNIGTQDIEGRVSLLTSGGNITAGRVGRADAAGTPAARLETAGGHIAVQDVQGELRASTAGGHISAANVRGDAVLRSSGGHIRAGSILGTAHLETGGGNISVQRVGKDVTATTGGGQIEFGEASGSISARTGGGGIRVVRVVGPMQLETGGGSILLTRVQGPVHASTSAGSITTWFASETAAETSGAPKARRALGPSQLESGQGDIVVYLPREMPMTIEATIEMGNEHHIEADPSLPLKLSYPTSPAGGRAVRGECALNGGGDVLRLKTAAGNIRLKFSDTDPQVRQNRQQMEQLKRRIELQQERLLELQRERERRTQALVEQQADQFQRDAEESAREMSRWEEWARKLEGLWSAGVRVDPEAQQRKLVHSVRPVYPDVARRAGIEGIVRLKAVIAKDGTIQDLKVLSGEPLLVNAALEAVRQWRYRPTLVDGKPMNVVTTVAVEFRLR